MTDGGTLAGEVRLAGPPPGPYVIWVKKDVDVFGETVPDERLEVGRSGGVRNAVVILHGVTAGKPWPVTTPRIANQGGRFVPHVQVARRDAEIEIVNRDPVLHNTHAYQDGRTAFNLAQPIRDQVVKRVLRRPGMLELMCDAHDWMSAWIIVSDHPYVAVTGTDGRWQLADVPPGTYRLVAWHEKLGTRELPVTVAPRQRRSVTITFEAS